MGKSTPQMPTAPNPTQVAGQQQQYNQQTALANAEYNRVNQSGPTGSSTYSISGYNPDGTPIYSQSTTLNPQEQQLFNTQMGVANTLGGTAQGVAGQLPTSLNYSGATPIQTGYSGGGNIQQSYQPGGNIQTNLDFSQLGAIPTAGQFAGQAQDINNAVYNQATSRLDPQWNLQQQQLQASLAAKGVTEGSQAYQNAMDQFQRQKTDAYNQATYSGIQQGAAEQQQLFGMALQGRQQGVNEITGQGQFANQAEAQQNAQNAAQAAFGNTAQAQANQQAAALAQFNNQARAQQVGEANTLYQTPYSTLGSLLGQMGSASNTVNPQFTNVPGVYQQNVDYAGLVNQQYQDQMQQYQQKMAQQSSALGGIFGMLGSAASAIPW